MWLESVNDDVNEGLLLIVGGNGGTIAIPLTAILIPN